MNRPLVSVSAYVLAVLLCFSLAHGQQKTSSTNDQTNNAELREKAFKLIESLADQLGTLQSAENRARMGSNIAESLWTRDEARARTLFNLVAEDIKLGLQKPDEDDEQSEQTFYVFLKLREDNVERIARHDPELALAFLKETFVAVAEAMREPHGKVPRSVTDLEYSLEMRLAKRIGPRDANVTSQLARQSLEHGLSPDLVALVLRLNEKNKDEAQNLYKAIVQKIAESNFNETIDATALTQQLIVRFAPPEADATTYKQLIDVFLKQAFAAGCEQKQFEQTEEGYSVCAFIRPVLSLMERYSPAQVRRLSHLAAKHDENPLPWISWMESELHDLMENGTVDEMLALAPKYPDFESPIYWRAIAMAQANGDLETAKKIADRYSGNPNVRSFLARQVEQQSTSEEQLEQRFEGIQQNKSLSLRQSIQILMDLAAEAAQSNPKLAVKVLKQIETTVNALKPGDEQTQRQIQLATLYCSAKNDRGFAMIESLLPKLNDLVAAAAKLDAYDTRYLRDGEWNMSAAGSIGNILTYLAGNAGQFAWSDFDRAVSLTGQFERNEIRMMAQLKLAQGILAGPPKPQFRRGVYLY